MHRWAKLLPLSTLAARMKFSVRRVGQARTMTTAPLPATAAETTAHAPWPVRLLSHKMAEYISRMSPVWIEGQVIQLNANNASSLAFITLRDISVDMSLNVTIPKRTLDRKSTRLNSRHVAISYAVFCLKKKTRPAPHTRTTK